MQLQKILVLAALSALAGVAQAAGLAPDDMDCIEILERYAADPDSVPQHLVDECKERLAGVAPAVAPAAGTAAAAADPCAGPGAADSVFCWGPWGALAPAAAGQPLPAPLVALADTPQRPEVLGIDPQLSPPDAVPPGGILPGCDPGGSCGFATIVAGASSTAPAGDTALARFDLAADGSQFTVVPGVGDPTQSVTGMSTSFSSRPDQFESMRARGTDGDRRSRIIARVIRDNGQLAAAADIWTDGDLATGAVQSGYFAWGRASSQADLEGLQGGTRSLSFAGPMSVDNSTLASIQVDFGPQTAWSGSWSNPAWSFSAGGAVSGVNLVSSPDRFSDNVLPGSAVQGALLGGDGNRSLTHLIDVNLEQAGRIRDVGLLRETN